MNRVFLVIMLMLPGFSGADDNLTLARISHHPSTVVADPLAVTGHTRSSRFDRVPTMTSPSSTACAPPQRLLDTLVTKCGEKCGLESFAEGFEIETNGNAAIYRLELPKRVYKTVTRSDLGDIRVFNNDRQRVPHAIRRAEESRVAQTVNVKLPFFPLHQAVQQISNSDNLDVTIEEDGTIIQIRSRGQAYEAQDVEIGSYIVDLSGIKKRLDEIEIDLTGQDEGYIKRLSLQTSNDLNHWSHLLNATLSDLQYGQYSLRQNKIDLPSFSAKYLRINWQDNSEGLQIASIRASLDTVRYERTRQWQHVTGEKTDSDVQLYQFDSGGLFPIDRINIQLPENNTLIEATLMSRPDEKSKWRHRYRGMFYRLNVSGNVVESSSVTLRTTTDRYWQLEVETDDGLGTQNPDLEFGWIANDLYFVARGEVPFYLAYGNSNIDAADKPVERLMSVFSEDQERDFIDKARPGRKISLMGETALNPDLVIQWQRILLWAVLIIGVMTLGFMVLRLLKQLNGN